jgi:4-diphosphocytidyl-2-C-methyl-D-erythritol kinase
VKKLKIKSYCKVNLTLRVLRKESNGYHKIRTLITFCNLHDIITISKVKNSLDKITFSGKFKKGISKKDNTVTKVLKLFRKEKFVKNQFFKINIHKNIPHGSGLGGGSSNAAALINYLNYKLKLKLNKIKIKYLARKIGFDVPICLQKKNSLITGKKDKILRSNKKFNFILLIVYPNLICSTKKIYQRNNQIYPIKQKNYLKIEENKKLISYLMNDRNDLEKVVSKIYPKVKSTIKLIGDQKGCYFARISGSGSACFGLFSNTNNAIYAKKLIKLKYPKYWSVISKTI